MGDSTEMPPQPLPCEPPVCARMRNAGALLKCVVGVAALAIAFYGFWRMRRDYLLFADNSDLLYLESLFRDLVSHRYRLTGWQLTPAPYFFPDMPLFFLSRPSRPMRPMPIAFILDFCWQEL